MNLKCKLNFYLHRNLITHTINGHFCPKNSAYPFKGHFSLFVCKDFANWTQFVSPNTFSHSFHATANIINFIILFFMPLLPSIPGSQK